MINYAKKKVRLNRAELYICIVTVLKLMLMGLFSSDYMNKMFMPFVSYFVNEGNNPYQHFYEVGELKAFPYPVVMLLIQSIGSLIIKQFKISSSFICNLFFKLPSLLFDFIGLQFITKIFPDKRKYAMVLYFTSPIILYSVYMHGQLDLIPTVFLLCSIYFLSSKVQHSYIWGGACLVCALLSKLHIVAVLPIIFLYLYKKDSIKKALIFSIIVSLVTVATMLPFMSEGFKQIVLFNSEQSILTQVVISLSSVDIYIPIVAMLLIYLTAFGVGIINRNLFVNLCGIVFAVFLALCPPMPGWYVWVVPYVALFFMNIDEGKYKNIVIYVLLNGLYLIYFVFLHNRSVVDLYFLNKDMSYLKVNNSTLSNLFFTLLAGTLIYIIFEMYKLGITSNSFYKRRNMPFTIGIAGDSGTGKSTFINIVESALGKRNLKYIEGDGDHKWERGEPHWEEYTHLNPKANFLYRQAHDLSRLKKGGSVSRVDYVHDIGKFTSARKIRPSKYIILCGLHSLYLPQTRKNLDLKIYMDVDETLRRYWKIQRDTVFRGYSKEKILKQIEDRMPDAIKYIYPQKDYADMIVQYYDKTLMDCMDDDHEVELSVRITISAAINAELLANELAENGLHVAYDYSNDLQTQIIDLDAARLESLKIPVEKIANRIIPWLEEVTHENLDSQNGVDGILKLFILLLISSKMKGEI